MTAKEKAQDLIFNFMSNESEYDSNDMIDISNSIKFSIIAVNQIIEEIIEIDFQMFEGGLMEKNLKYWQEVKNELENYDT